MRRVAQCRHNSLDLGRAVVANAATQILLRQAPQTIGQIAAAFALSDGEKQFLLTAETGSGLLASGTQRVAFQAAASPAEDQLITSRPADLVDDHTDTGDTFIDLPDEEAA